jgi:hypothetical protein
MTGRTLPQHLSYYCMCPHTTIYDIAGGEDDMKKIASMFKVDWLTLWGLNTHLPSLQTPNGTEVRPSLFCSLAFFHFFPLSPPRFYCSPPLLTNPPRTLRSISLLSFLLFSPSSLFFSSCYGPDMLTSWHRGPSRSLAFLLLFLSLSCVYFGKSHVC